MVGRSIKTVDEQHPALLGARLMLQVLCISLVEFVTVGHSSLLHSLLNCFSSFEKVWAVAAPHHSGPEVEVQVEFHGVEFVKLVCASSFK